MKKDYIEYLGHKFFETEGGGIHRCKTCNLRVYIRMKINYVEQCLMLIDHKVLFSSFVIGRWDELPYTCDEIIIKNIIE